MTHETKLAVQVVSVGETRWRHFVKTMAHLLVPSIRSKSCSNRFLEVSCQLARRDRLDVLIALS